MRENDFLPFHSNHNPNMNIIQDNEAINRILPPFLGLALANRIRRILPNEIQINYTIKGGPLEKMVCLKFWLHIPSLGENIEQSKWRTLWCIFLWEASRIGH